MSWLSEQFGGGASNALTNPFDGNLGSFLGNLIPGGGGFPGMPQMPQMPQMPGMPGGGMPGMPGGGGGGGWTGGGDLASLLAQFQNQGGGNYGSYGNGSQGGYGQGLI